jgi:hypothetical protein
MSNQAASAASPSRVTTTGWLLSGQRATISNKLRNNQSFSDLLQHCETLPVIPREIEDILTIKTSERHRWLSDGRLPSAGTRNVRLNGRARRITFHVFDPKVVEDILDRGLVEDWREEDAISKAENRRKAAYAAKLTRSLKALGKAEKAWDGAGNIRADEKAHEQATALRGWAEFDIDGLLR